MRVLLADADVTFLEIAQTYLHRFGHEVTIAVDGLECMAALRHFTPEVAVLSDDLLWGGFEGVVAVMRDSPRLVAVPVLGIGTWGTFPTCPQFPGTLETRPTSGWLEKPFNLRSLQAELKRLETRVPRRKPHLRRRGRALGYLTTFLQPCPVCGRALQVPMEWLGDSVACGHCGATLVADGESCEPLPHTSVESPYRDRLATVLRSRA